jgi:hypothetical protein
MFKKTAIMLIVLILSAIGCQAQNEHPLNLAMQSVSRALHAKDVNALKPLLSEQTTASLDEVFKSMCAVHITAKKLPEVMREKLTSQLPKSVINKNEALFLEELTAKKLPNLKFDEQTEFGITVDKINQESKKAAIVITKSGESFAFTLEKSVWKIHLFKAPLAKLLKDTRSLQQTVNLVIERVARRAQIESVLHSIAPKKKTTK